MKNSFKTAICIFALLAAAGCGHNANEPTDTSTTGSIQIYADDGYEPVIDAEITTFEALYPYAKIDVHYTTEDSVMKAFLASDSVRLAVVARKLTKEEVNYFHSIELFPEQDKVATDALALIVNNNNPDTLLSVDKIKAIFNGQDSTWQSIDKKSKPGKITVVFDHENSSNSRYIQQNLMDGKKFPAYCFAVKSNRQVINYVSKNPEAIGVISINWVSDGYDPTVIKELSKIKIAALSLKEDTNANNYYQPSPYYLKMNLYPLGRDMYIISREARTGLGSGFLSFVTSDRGQRIVLRAGLLPTTVPTHIIQF